ncbi:hypothetical protein COT75_01855 [Candidatus Beckwithbacteria bacterium CG10_big_fil_rev_8_21_14_0_10_34_10]|uniref:Glycosyltransferase RgtA/B/C/D-like domain-containing protein n=1 Tax=Candidatus Beckwithbacteria bacterium CG10_big_fil_rev_8_21_14_0_10_34_10 TaxID=1974495 RepID=A0A2H0W9S8_9BACT|nr:MAG: hypothetical protein COT75_01855 [Candidatus Beckwithbacteria bacterium CG10_big_fil_rev_8_21_14_0_10_34_10]
MKKIINWKSIIIWVKKNKFILLSLILFLLVRTFILLNPPADYLGVPREGYSDVTHFYEGYANMWWYGLTPYLEHLFEYPPAAIPLIALPLAVDLAGVGFYYLNYRVQIFLIELVIYFFILKTLKKTFSNPFQRYASIIFYNLAPIIANGFWYDGIDLAFSGSLILALISYLFLNKQKFIHKVVFWSLFWLSVAIKFVTFPLFFLFFIIKNKNFKKSFKEEFIALVTGFLIIWAVPLAVFRSSLSVALFFHAKRPLHASSFPAFIIYTINHFTNSEVFRNLEWFGPLTQKALFLSFIFLGVTTVLVSFWAIMKKIKDKQINPYTLMLKTSLIYLLAFMMTSKIISPPFHIWTTLLLTVFPYKNRKTQFAFLLLGLWTLILNTTNIVKLPETIMIYPFTWQYLRHILRFPPLILIAFLMMKKQEKFIKS